jgi:hypothetical protein
MRAAPEEEEKEGRKNREEERRKSGKKERIRKIVPGWAVESGTREDT